MATTLATSDDPNLVSAADLVPAVELTTNAGPRELADRHLTVPTDKGTRAGPKVAPFVAGIVAGAQSIDDVALFKGSVTIKLFTGRYASSTPGSFLRSFTLGHVRQLDAVASRVLTALSQQASLLFSDSCEHVCIDADHTIVEVHVHP